MEVRTRLFGDIAIEDDKIIITVLNIGHRREVYNK